jgi:hypothetical protein
MLIAVVVSENYIADQRLAVTTDRGEKAKIGDQL